MFKTTPYKIMTGSALAAIILCGSIGPTYAHAAETTPSTMVATQKDNAEKYEDYLGPEGLKRAMEKTGSDVFVMDMYALTLWKQPNINFEGITEISPSLQANILKHQKTAKANATEWMDSLKPKMMQTNTDIRDYTTTFQSHSDTILQAIKNQEKDTVVQGLERLASDIQDNKQGIDQLIADLKGFQIKLNQDQQNFETDDNQIQSQIDGKNTALTELKEKIDKYNANLQKSQSQFDTWKWVVIGGCVVLGVTLVVVGVKLYPKFIEVSSKGQKLKDIASRAMEGATTAKNEYENTIIEYLKKGTSVLKSDVEGAKVIAQAAQNKSQEALLAISQHNYELGNTVKAIVGVTGLGTALGGAAAYKGVTMMNNTTTDIANNMDELQQLTDQLTKTEANVLQLQNVKGQIKVLSDTIQRAIQSLQNISDQWSNMGEKYTTLLQKVKQMNPEHLDSLKGQLQSANEQWKEIHELAGVLYTQDLKWSDVDTKDTSK